jgi:hypothetical protein
MKLTKEELNIILPMVMRLLREKSTKNNPLYGARIVDWLNYKREDIGFNSPMTESKLRKCINYIRTNGLLPVIADDNGYYITNDPIVIRDMAASLRRRTASINAAAGGLEELARRIDPKEDSITQYVNKHNYGRNEDRVTGEYIYVGMSEKQLH